MNHFWTPLDPVNAHEFPDYDLVNHRWIPQSEWTEDMRNAVAAKQSMDAAAAQRGPFQQELGQSQFLREQDQQAGALQRQATK